MLGTIDIVLVTQNADAHVRAGDGGQLDGARETCMFRSVRCRCRYRRRLSLGSARRTLVTLGVIVLQADLELDGLQEVALLGVVAVVEKRSNVLTHTGCESVSLSAWRAVGGGNRVPTVILDMLGRLP